MNGVFLVLLLVPKAFAPLRLCLFALKKFRVCVQGVFASLR